MDSPSPHRVRRIVISPIYNEMKAIESVLPRIAAEADLVIAVDDGSTDGTSEYLARWSRNNPHALVVKSRRNGGTSVALRKGYVLVAHLLESGCLAPDDCVVEVDADGQHDPKYIGELCDRFLSFEGAIDVVLARRDFRVYPKYKVWGNWALTRVASLLAGFRYKDVESNFRVLPAARFRELLRWYGGYRYSAAFEVGIILGDLGYRIDNDYVIQVPLYRYGAGVTDGIPLLLMGLRAWVRRRLGLTSPDLESFSAETLDEAVFPEWYREKRAPFRG
jgi:glycosyltransferase involved in cell wall biosynthesis